MTEIDNMSHMFDEDDKRFIEYALKYHNVNDISKKERNKQYISYTSRCEAHMIYRIALIQYTRLYECQHAKLRKYSVLLSDVLGGSFCEFGFKEWQFILSSEYEYHEGIIENMSQYIQDRFILIIPKIDDNVVYVDGAMMENGYYKIHTDECVDKDGNIWLYLLYLPSRLYYLTEYFRAVRQRLYYIAPLYKESYIDEYGIIAEGYHPVFSHNTKEIYMYSGSQNTYVDRDETTLNMLRNNICIIDNKNSKSDYIIYLIHSEYMSDDAMFFRDPYSIHYCYCKTDIPISAIEKYGTFDINDINSHPKWNGLFSRLNIDYVKK